MKKIIDEVQITDWSVTFSEWIRDSRKRHPDARMVWYAYQTEGKGMKQVAQTPAPEDRTPEIEHDWEGEIRDVLRNVRPDVFKIYAQGSHRYLRSRVLPWPMEEDDPLEDALAWLEGPRGTKLTELVGNLLGSKTEPKGIATGDKT